MKSLLTGFIINLQITEETQSGYIESNERREFLFVLDRNVRDNWVYGYSAETLTKSVEKNRNKISRCDKNKNTN